MKKTWSKKSRDTVPLRSIKFLVFKPLDNLLLWNVKESIIYKLKQYFWYTHKTSGYKTSGLKTSGFKTSEKSSLLNVSFTKRQVYKMSGLQNVRSSERQVAKIHTYIFCTCGWRKSAGSQVLLQPCLQAQGWLCFILYFRGFFLPYITIMACNK